MLPVEDEAKNVVTSDLNITVSASRKEGENKSPFQVGMGKEKLKTLHNDNYLQKFCCKGKGGKERATTSREEKIDDFEKN